MIWGGNDTSAPSCKQRLSCNPQSTQDVQAIFPKLLSILMSYKLPNGVSL